MTVFITGDTHGRLDIGKLLGMNFDATGLNKDDYMIIVGDLGLVWDPPQDTGYYAQRNENTLDWLDAKPWTTLFIDGNHENHDLLNSYPVSEWHGGRVHFIRDSVIHLMRGEMFNIDGKSYFAMGGAQSIDRDSRIEGESWWAGELPNEMEMSHAIETLDSYGWSCDYVLTHDCPANVKFELGCRNGCMYQPDSYSQWLQYLAENMSFSQWFFGHYHEDYAHIGNGGKYTVLYNCIYDIDGGEWSERINVPFISSAQCLPDSIHRLGYTIEELADIANVPIETVEQAMSTEMYGSTVALSEDGKTLIYPSDALRVLSWC